MAGLSRTVLLSPGGEGKGDFRGTSHNIDQPGLNAQDRRRGGDQAPKVRNNSGRGKEALKEGEEGRKRGA